MFSVFFNVSWMSKYYNYVYYHAQLTRYVLHHFSQFTDKPIRQMDVTNDDCVCAIPVHVEYCKDLKQDKNAKFFKVDVHKFGH